MPTDLPVRRRDETIAIGWQHPLVKFYIVAALLTSLVIAVEFKAGVFDKLTVAEAALKATGTELPNDEIGVFAVAARPQQ
jgi:hypothetical protein